MVGLVGGPGDGVPLGPLPNVTVDVDLGPLEVANHQVRTTRLPVPAQLADQGAEDLDAQVDGEPVGRRSDLRRSSRRLG